MHSVYISFSLISARLQIQLALTMAANSDVKLLGSRASPFVNRVKLALNLKSINYEFHLEKLSDKSELLLKSNPIHKKVPVLIHGDKAISESLVIVQYIDEAFPDGPSILPSDPYDRATARFWAAYIDDKWFPMLLSLVKEEGSSDKAEVFEKVIEGLVLLEDAFVKSSNNNGKGFFGGDRPGYLDVVLGCFLSGIKVAEIRNSNVKILDETKTPSLAKWTERMMSHEAVKGLPDPQELQSLLVKAYQPAVEASN